MEKGIGEKDLPYDTVIVKISKNERNKTRP